MQKVENSQNIFLVCSLFDYNVSYLYKKYSLSDSSLNTIEDFKSYRIEGKKFLDNIAKLISDIHCVDFASVDNLFFVSLFYAKHGEFEEFMFLLDKVI